MTKLRTPEHSSPVQSPDVTVRGKIDGEDVHSMPRGYARTDERVREDIEERLRQRVETADERFTVHVRNGEVTLAGDASTMEARVAAEKIALSVIGANRLKIRINLPSEPM